MNNGKNQRLDARPPGTNSVYAVSDRPGLFSFCISCSKMVFALWAQVYYKINMLFRIHSLADSHHPLHEAEFTTHTHPFPSTRTSLWSHDAPSAIVHANSTVFEPEQANRRQLSTIKIHNCMVRYDFFVFKHMLARAAMVCDHTQT